MRALQPLIQTHPPRPLVPESLTPLIHLQNTRLVLHRRNLSPVCAREVRMSAIDSCIAIARDTVKFLSRMVPDRSHRIDPEGGPDTWVDRIPLAASSMFCTHLWRCTLFLCLGGYFPDAQICVRASAAVGDLCPVNRACGKYLTFFLGCLVEKTQHGERSQSLETDEEMLAYVSGDLQGDFQNAWVWQGNDYGRDHSPTDRRTTDVLSPEEERGGRNTDPFGGSSRISSPHMEPQPWTGWDHVSWLLERLSAERGLNAGHGRSSAPPALTTTTVGPLQHSTTSTSGRISIADII